MSLLFSSAWAERNELAQVGSRKGDKAEPLPKVFRLFVVLGLDGGANFVLDSRGIGG